MDTENKIFKVSEPRKRRNLWFVDVIHDKDGNNKLTFSFPTRRSAFNYYNKNKD